MIFFQMNHTNKRSIYGPILSGSLLISGTCIGGGMLGLPVMTGQAGFIPALLINLLSWVYMLLTGLLYLQANLWMPGESNLASMSNRFLGTIAKNVGSSFFLLLYYCLLIAYISGITPLFSHFFKSIQLAIDPVWIPYLTVFIFGCIIFLGAKTIDRINILFMLGLFITFCLLIVESVPTTSTSLLLEKNWSYSILAAPILFSAYGYHNIIPTISTYLKRDKKKVVWSVIIGTSIPFIVYTLWQWVIIGNVPKEALAHAAHLGLPVTEVIKPYMSSVWFSKITYFFSIFALVTSLIGVSYSMIDFLGDSLKINKKGIYRLFLCLLVFMPPLLFSQTYPGMFIRALSFAGGFGESVLNGIFPVLMVWRGHQHFKLKCFFPFLRNKILLSSLLIFTLFIIVAEIFELSVIS